MNAPDQSRAIALNVHPELRPLAIVDISEDCRLELQLHQDLLYARVSGQDSGPNTLAYLQRVLEQCVKHEIRRLLIVEDMEGALSREEIFENSAEVAQAARDLDLRVAFFDQRRDHHYNNLFGELVALEAGVQARVCDSPDEARQWLGIA